MNAIAQNLTPRQKKLACCAALMAKGDQENLSTAIIGALDEGVTVNELKEAFSQLYAYAGFPRSLNALGTLSKVLENRKPNWEEGKAWTKPSMWNDAKKALKAGTDVQTQLCGGTPFNYEFCPQDDYYLKSHLFGDIFAGDILCPSDREILTVAALSAMTGVESQLASHKAGAVNMGNSKETIDELCEYLDKEGLTLRSEFEKGNPNSGYAQYFIGSSYLNPIQPQSTLQKGRRQFCH